MPKVEFRFERRSANRTNGHLHSTRFPPTPGSRRPATSRAGLHGELQRLERGLQAASIEVHRHGLDRLPRITVIDGGLEVRNGSLFNGVLSRIEGAYGGGRHVHIDPELPRGAN